MRLPRSLQGRLLVMVIGLVAGVWVVTALLTWIDVRHELDELLDSHLAQAASLLVARQAGELEDDDHAINAPTLHRYAPKVAFQVFHEGRLVLRSANAPSEPMLAFTGRVDDGFRTVTTGSATWRVFATHGREHDVQVFVGEQVESRNSILWAVLRSALAPLLFALPLLALAAWWAVRRGVAPMKVLGRALAEREPQALQPIAVDGLPSEMAPMLDALNRLFQRITELMASERRFTADAAHELRTPLTALKLQLDLARRAADPGARAAALDDLDAAMSRAAHLVDQLLTLARVEPESLAERASDVDLVELAKEAIVARAPVAADKGVDLGLARAAPAHVRGDPASLAILMANLIDNALRYTPPGGRVDVAVDAGPAPVFSVADTGPGIAAEERERVFDRFYRGGATAEAGSGLGLSIVKRVADAHHATLRLATPPAGTGLLVEVRFPGPPIP